MRFSEILLIATVATGAIWIGDKLYQLGKPRLKKDPWWIEYGKSFFPVLLVVLALRSFVIEPFRIPSGSMRPTLIEGDFIVVNKFIYGLKIPFMRNKLVSFGKPKRGDIIVFKHKENGTSLDLIKRVVGLSGDLVEYKDNGIFINGKPMRQIFLGEVKENGLNGSTYLVRKFEEDLEGKKHDIFVQNEVTPYFEYASMVVPENSYFVIGDNRDNSKDSRAWGPVPDEDVQGKAFGIWMSWDDVNYRIRWDRLTFALQ